MIPIKKMGFKTLKEIGTAKLDQDLLDLCLCIRNAWNLENQDIWFRELEGQLELAVVIGHDRDRRSFETLITVDELLENFRKRNFAIGEIKPDVANFVLISIFKDR